mmetsp:Transcript_25594/g.72068  ORF Transcript_25594/g.72068 Transcript_25594/m.72068 type:complete len:269 (+) Transcript_25594:64-870(+)
MVALGVELPAGDSFVSDLKLLVVPPLDGKSFTELKAAAKVLNVQPACDTRRLKELVLDAFRGQIKTLTPCDMTLYFQNREGSHSQRLELLEEEDALRLQGVSQGALVVCQLATWDRPVSKLGESAYYMWAENQQAFPDEIRVQGGGAPARIGETAVAEHRPLRTLKNYSWNDESRCTVKLYISAEGEPEALAAARGSKDGRVQADFKEQSLEVRILGENVTYILAINELEHRVVPEECKVKVVAGKRIAITLRKEKEDSLWNTLYRLK